MEIEGKTRHYIEVFYNYNPDRGNQDDFTTIHIITDRDPLLYIEKYKGAIGFRFFDVNGLDSFQICEKRKNVSSIYYYGRYITEEEIHQVHKVLPYTSSITKMIDCDCGCLITNLNEDDITLEELINPKKLKNYYKQKILKF